MFILKHLKTLQHVSSRTLLIFRKTKCIITASGIVTLSKQPYSMPVECGLQLCEEVCRTTVRHTPSHRTHVNTPYVMLPHHHIDFLHFFNKF